MKARGFYEETEDHYTNILYEYILRESIFATNDGVLREKQVGFPGKRGGPVVDLITRLGDLYIAIEVKVWPHTFEECFQKTSKLLGKVDLAFVAIPVEYVSIAKDIVDKGLYPVGILPISLTTKPTPVKRSKRMRGNAKIKMALQNQFSFPYYGKAYAPPYGELGKLEVEYYEKVWDTLTGFYRPNRKKIAGNTLSFLVFYAMSKIHSRVKYLYDTDVYELSNELANDANIRIAKYGIVWGLRQLGITEIYQMGRAKIYHRLNPRLMTYLDAQGKNKLENFLSKNNLKDPLMKFVERKKENMYKKRTEEISNYID